MSRLVNGFSRELSPKKKRGCDHELESHQGMSSSRDLGCKKAPHNNKHEASFLPIQGSAFVFCRCRMLGKCYAGEVLLFYFTLFCIVFYIGDWISQRPIYTTTQTLQFMKRPYENNFLFCFAATAVPLVLQYSPQVYTKAVYTTLEPFLAAFLLAIHR